MTKISQLAAVALERIIEHMRLSDDEKRAVNSLVLLNPDLMKAQYSTSEVLAAEAERYAKEGNSIVASTRFESAAKLALYEGNLSSSKNYLEKRVSMGRSSPFDIALTSFDKVASCVLEYYKNKTA